MAQWGTSDAATNSVSWAAASLNKGSGNAAQAANNTALFGNTTADAFVTGQTVGQFGVDSTEVGVQAGGVVAIEIISGGSGYDSTANDALVIAGGGGSSATATFTNTAQGVINAITITDGGSSYETSPTVTVNATGDNGNTAAANGASFVAVVGGAQGVAHTGWNLRIVGSGGRAGRVQYETLVAGGIGTDAEDVILPDA